MKRLRRYLYRARHARPSVGAYLGLHVAGDHHLAAATS